MAYVKFMAKTLQKREEESEAKGEEDESDDKKKRTASRKEIDVKSKHDPILNLNVNVFLKGKS